ncbi:MAG: alpha-L-glutamate ligase, partial [Sphingomonas sp.]
ALDARGVEFSRATPDGFWNPADQTAPARVVFNRIAMSSFLRSDEHPIFDTMAMLDHWRRTGARVINGADVLAIDASKARQLSLIASLGLAIPETRVVHRAADVVAAAQTLRFPLVVKANIGGSGAGIIRFDSLDELRAAVTDDGLPSSVDGVLLVQEYVPVRGGAITRIETLDRKFLYAIDVAGGGAFDARAIASAASMSTCDGVARFYDINALSNFVAKPLDVLGWDPHDRLVDYLIEQIGKTR